MTLQDIFITGTDTAVGKTTVACGIAAALRHRGMRVGVCKPAETGCSPGSNGELFPEDAARLRFFSACQSDLHTICPYRLREPLAPLVAAQREGIAIDIERIVRCRAAVAANHDITLIEGAGGLLVPLTASHTFADLAAHLRAPVLVVVGSRLGAINHALLTVRYAQSIGLHVLGYVVNFLSPDADTAARTNVEVLSELLGPPLGVIPHLGTVEMTERNRQQMAQVFAAQLRLDALLLPR